MGYTLPSKSSPAEQARALMASKDEIEAAIGEQGEILRTNNADMHTPLVDREGFPRADIDVWAVRTARVRVIELRNDLKEVRERLGKALEGVYERGKGTEEAKEEEAKEQKLRAFAKVNSVAPGSPAAEAGMQREDLVLKFGHLTSDAFTQSSLQPLAELVAANENKSISVLVRRAQATIALKLTPRQGWGGRGMLGCAAFPGVPSASHHIFSGVIFCLLLAHSQRSWCRI
ncbi:hypothetical protein K488DRAFT_41112 [Vararia minispora EC-137]|uniref:Uncharacterized protein n=1 Tax=Vararia minispora EC-137 TaxID=1314806 RepID=A0ACB8QXA1_9AGAM|nr:hypothetical protein K488DRAFT_41112 [Vararia minispora EC-137]